MWSPLQAAPHQKSLPVLTQYHTPSLTLMQPKTIPPRTMDYISMVTDPYHDRNLRVTGFPDGRTMMSAIKRYALQVSLTCPFTLTEGTSWSFHIFTTPLHFVTPFFPCQLTGNIIPNLHNASPTQYVGPVNVLYTHRDGSGAVLATKFSPLGPQPHVAADNGRDAVRTVSLAFELHNTTASLYKSGALTTYRLNDEGTRADYYRSDGATPPNYQSYTFTHLTTIPKDLADANSLPNARTWEAGKGIYSVSLPMVANDYSSQLFQNVGISTGRSGDTRDYLLYAKEARLDSGSASWSPMSCTGVMSSAYMNTEQTFTLDLRQVLEFAPSPKSYNLPYATTSPECDLLFLKLYKRMINTIEPGVPVNFNSAGEWFRRILSIAKEQLPHVVHLIPPQYRPIAQLALPVVNKIADTVINKLDKPPKSKPKSPKPKKTRLTRPVRAKLALLAKAQRMSPASKQ